MFNLNEMALFILGVYMLLFLILMYIIISNAIDGRDRKLKRLEALTIKDNINKNNRFISK